MTRTPDIIAFTPLLRSTTTDTTVVDRLQGATLEILERVGVCFPCEPALEVFRRHGADVDGDGVVKLPPDLVERALATAPRSFVLGGREPRFDLILDGTRTYLATEGVGVRVRDPETGEERRSRKGDVELMARVADALPAISFFWPPVSAQDHARTAPLHECHAGLTNTLKHVRGATTMHPRLAERVVEMATVVAGSEAARRARPPICGNICTISPLSQDDTGIEAALVYAGAGIPVSFMAMPTMGSTAPASLAGAIVQGEAEVVSAMVLVQLAFPGAPVFHSNLISAMDPRSGGYIGDIEAPAERLVTRLGHAWGVPHLCGPSVSGDEASIGWGFGSRAGIGAALLSGTEAEISGDLGGLLDSYTLLEPHFIVLQHELVLTARRMLEELAGDADLALGVIEEVGPRGHYLAQAHTRVHVREFPLPLRSRGPGHATAEEAARAEFARLARDHEPAPLPADVLTELDRILAEAERDAERLAR
ncbi:MAG: trimethylamine methyltransferase family protein [Deltaproteobacteria bacterium]